jgi:predicted DNA-binding ArsR family transcriptional regulator
MPQPISSKLATVAQLMDHFILEDNYAHVHEQAILVDTIHRLSEQVRLLCEQVTTLQASNRAQADDLHDTLNQNERLIEAVYRLETSILDCEGHPGRELLFSVPPTAMRRLSFGEADEIIDLTTSSDEETEMDIHDVEL